MKKQRQSCESSARGESRQTRASSLASSRQPVTQNKTGRNQGCQGCQPSTRNNNYDNNSRSRSQELVYNRQKPQAPNPPVQASKDVNNSSFINLNDIISDHIGTIFFQNVLGMVISLFIC